MFFFHYRVQECKIGSQETPGVKGKFGFGVWNEAGQTLIEFCQENALVVAYPLPTTQDSTHRHHQMVNTEIRLIIFFAAKMEMLYTVNKTRLGADCGSDHELLITKFRLKLKSRENH